MQTKILDRPEKPAPTPETDNAMNQMLCFSDHPAVECLSDLSRKLERQRDALEAALRKLKNFTFLQRWPTKGLDEDAQSMYDEVEAALSLVERDRMTTEEDFEKWWAIGVSIDEAHRIAKTGQAGKECARIAYLAATQRTAQRCVEICWIAATEDAHAFDCASRIREQFLP